MNIRFSGFGGQGIVFSGVILGWAAILDGKNAVQTQSYGSEARGGACKCDVIIKDTEIYELEPAQLDILVAFSQTAYNKYHKFLKPDGILFVDKYLVKPYSHPEKTYGIAATDIALIKLHYRIMANMVMLGYVIAKTELLKIESVEKGIRTVVSDNMAEENIKAFKAGLYFE
jgi:2-oxoglutarate ferredoxin oxidoreductase subunit gamma